jgi:hypothetical protein
MIDLERLTIAMMSVGRGWLLRSTEGQVVPALFEDAHPASKMLTFKG